MKIPALTLIVSAVLAVRAFAARGPSLDVPVSSPAIARAAGSQQKPQIATDGHDFFAVWLDSRSGHRSLYGTRILADGTVLDPTGILLNGPEQSADSVVLTWDGSNYVVVWQGDSRVNFVRVDRNGSVLGPPQTVFANGAQPSVASNGHGTIAAIHIAAIVGNRVVQQYRTALISQDGTVTQKPVLDFEPSSVQIASSGDGYLVTWLDLKKTATFWFRLDDNGNLVAGSAQYLPGDIYAQLAAGTGGRYLLLDRRFAGFGCARSIVGRFITAGGISDPFVIHDSGGDNIQDIAVTPAGNGFQVVWMKRLGDLACPYGSADPPGPITYPPFGLEQIHVGQSGDIGAPAMLTEGSPSDGQPAIASNGAALALVWIESDATQQIAKVAAAIAQPGGQTLPVPIASSAAAQSDPVVAAGDGAFMTVWREERRNDGASDIYARQFNTDGRPLDVAAIKVSTNDHARIFYPAVSFDGAVWLFVWFEDFKVVARRMALNETWIDQTPLTIGPASGLVNFATASNGNGFAVLTLTQSPTLTLLPRTGDMHQAPLPLEVGFSENFSYPSMAWDGSGYAAVWTRGTNDTEGIRVAEDGRIITPRFELAGTSSTPSIACREGGCVAAWSSNNAIAVTNLFDGPSFMQFINPDAGGFVYQPKVLPTRDGFVLLWTERSGQTSTLFSASINHGVIGIPQSLGPIVLSSAAMTRRDQLALTFSQPVYDSESGGAVRAFLRVWPAVGRRRAVGP